MARTWTEEEKQAQRENFIGNDYAVKYTEEYTLECIKRLDDAFDTDLHIYAMEGLVLAAGDLPIKCIPYWKKIFKDNDKVLNAIKAIEKKMEMRILRNTQIGTAKSAALSIFLLKNKHGYTDKIETVNTNKDTITVNFNEE